jgi:hypothetical protein
MNREVALIGAQAVVVVVLGVLICLGHDSAISDALLAVCGSIAGTGLYRTIQKPSASAPVE